MPKVSLADLPLEVKAHVLSRYKKESERIEVALTSQDFLDALPLARKLYCARVAERPERPYTGALLTPLELKELGVTKPNYAKIWDDLEASRVPVDKRGPWAAFYQGQMAWQQAVKSGVSGQFVCPVDGNFLATYVGGCRNRSAEGFGHFFCLSSKLDAQGYWSAGKLNGIGIHRTTDSVAEGNFKDSLLHGKGVLVGHKKMVYTGDFIEGKFCGRGNAVLVDGTCYAGEWRDGELHGYGILTGPDGSTVEGRFERSRLVEVVSRRDVDGRLVTDSPDETSSNLRRTLTTSTPPSVPACAVPSPWNRFRYFLQGLINRFLRLFLR